MNLDDILARRGLKLEDLSSEEQETLFTWMNALDNQQINVETIRGYIRKMEEGVSQELASIEEAPTNWLSLLSFLVPMIGIIRKWYLDQRKTYLLARMRNYYLLGSMLSTPEQAKKAIEKQIAGISRTKIK
jgi:hypothetical protein